MQNEWILDVLADLRVFALTNKLPQLAEHLDDTAMVAMAEIANVEERHGVSAYEQAGEPRKHSGAIGAGELL